MLTNVILALALAYLVLAPFAFWAGLRRPKLAIRLWGVDLAVAVVLVALSVADGNLLLVAAWVLNAVLSVVNLRFALRAHQLNAA